MSSIKDDLLKRHIKPYCGASICKSFWPKTTFNGSQFECKCGWKTALDKEFIDKYKKKWSIE